MRSNNAGLLILAGLLFIAIFSCAAPIPVSALTADATPSAAGASDTTLDLLADVRLDDASGASPSSVSSGDGWYAVDKNIVLCYDYNTE